MMDTRLIAAVLTIICAPALAQSDTPLRLGLPIVCKFGENCFIQQYVDVDTGLGAKDYRCGGATYDGHKGTDFRVLSTKAADAGVPVVASAAGRVRSVRDGMADRLMESAADAASVADRECGNGVVIDHDGGWETQYCHLKQGSILVRRGQAVAAGAPLGLVGYSGQAQFAHVHLSVRRKREIIDPFLGATISGACQVDDKAEGAQLWTSEARQTMSYRDAVIIESGFAGAIVTPADAEMGEISAPSADGAALVYFARLINVRAGDHIRFKLDGPGGFQHMKELEPLEKNQAHYVGFVGKKRGGEHWPSGAYHGSVVIIRAGGVFGESSKTLSLP